MNIESRNIIKPIEFVDNYKESPVDIIDKHKYYKNTLFTSNRGEQVKVIEYIDGHHTTVESVITGFRYNTRISRLLNGNFGNNTIVGKVYVGQKYINNYGEEYEIVEIIDTDNIVVRFTATNCYRKIPYSCIRGRKIYNPYRLNEHGGYMGEGPYDYTNSKKAYIIWRGILIRSKNKNNQSCCPSYENVYLTDEWLNFQNFAMWYNHRYNILNPEFDYQIDKDIKQLHQTEKIKYYSKETCMLIPSKLNQAFVSVSVANKVKINGGALPLGVKQNPCGTYTIRLATNGKSKTFSNLHEAWINYKRSKVQKILQDADYYLKNGALLKEDYDWIFLACMNM